MSPFIAGESTTGKDGSLMSHVPYPVQDLKPLEDCKCCTSSANVSIGCWGKHDGEGWVADEPRALSSARLETSRGLQMLYSTAFLV